MGDWEDYVTKVCVLGRPEQMRGLASDWEALFYNADTVATELSTMVKDLEKTFTGAGGDAYRKHLTSIHDAIQKIRDDHSGIVHSLRQAAEDLDSAQQQMPVPDYMMDEVNNRRADLDRLNMAGARAMTIFDPVDAFFAPDAFYKPLADSFVGNWGREFFGHFSAWFDDWDGSMTAQAEQVYKTVNQNNLSTALAMPDPAPATGGHAYTDPGVDLGGPPGGPGAGHVPTMGSPGGPHPGTGGINPNTHGYGGVGDPSTGAGTGGFKDPSTGLAGAGGGGLSGLGGGGGLGSGGLGSGGGLGALGAGTGGLGASVGKSVSPTGMPAGGFGGLPMGAAGRGAAGKGAARSRPGMGMAGGHGGHGEGEGDERYTWLHEEDDVWGGGTDAPSGTIGQ